MTIATSNYLIDETPLMVLPTLAVGIGLNEALVIQKIHTLIKDNGQLRGGRKYVWKTTDEWKDSAFPFWSEPTIRRIFDNLEARNLLFGTDIWNNKGNDRTKGYAINYEALQETIQKCVIKMITQSDQNDQMPLDNVVKDDDDLTGIDTNGESSSFRAPAPEAAPTPEVVHGVTIPAIYRNTNAFEVWTSERPREPLTDFKAQMLGDYVDERGDREVVAALLIASMYNVQYALPYLKEVFSTWDTEATSAPPTSLNADAQRFAAPATWDNIES